MSHLALTIIFSILLLPAIFLTVLPMVPAISYMFFVSLLYGLIDGFNNLSFGEVGILGIIFALSLVVDYSAGVLGAKYAGAAKKSLLYGIIGLVIGTILFPPFGGIPGLFLGVLVSEIFLNKETRKALKSAVGSLAGTLAGVFVNFILAVILFISFIFFVF